MAWVLVAVLAVVALVVASFAFSFHSNLTRQRGAATEAEAARTAAAARADEVEQAANQTAQADAATIDSLRAELDATAARAAKAERDRMIDPDVLWSLEQARSERTWRFSVAPGPHSVSALREADPADTADLLVEALHVELGAAREDVGAVVELDAVVPSGISSAGAVITLRVAQELLADVVRRSETTTLRVRADGDDLTLTIDAIDEFGIAVVPLPLALPESPSIAVEGPTVTIRGAATDAASVADSTDLDTTMDLVAPDPTSLPADTDTDDPDDTESTDAP